ncbi:hypothetical protein MPC4_60118 [Methylocella tundrae]|uniref:Uncharacterized protein n=1 Tax=Methylocella tundrae TaxID=227605 RepID=A0A8B6MCL9_METTU|nr:hypothetical protein MPC1_11920001 [Methylocella tundrae]VTZ52029.1 hypothetical protein MPC4_60118 [Methylocella tundrae]
MTMSRTVAASMPIEQNTRHAAAWIAAQFCSRVSFLFSEARYCRDDAVFSIELNPSFGNSVIEQNIL